MPRKVVSTIEEGGNKKKHNSNKDMNKTLLDGYDAEDLIFALDIGTRTVVGVVGVEEGQKFRILAVEIIEHESRAMIDGQIHDVGRVAEVSGLIKNKLEESLGVSLTKVAIAAAGRVLKTCETVVERQIEASEEISRELASSLEMEAIQQAQLKLEQDVPKEEQNQFYCVGYSVINYFLNGFVISSILGHKGKCVGAKVLATFLPHIVVDSLYTVMNRVGLEVTSLTLEPIAAINVTIPKDLRLLNLALVDIGAGTSDIALTREGSVVAYGMVPMAGDEITEKIAQHYLVDFNTAEKIKIALASKKQSISFMDILGKKNTVDRQEVEELIMPAVDNLAKTISQRITEFNGRSPNAVFLIGGGSQVRGLAARIAEYLDLPLERVAVRDRSVIQNVIFSGKKLSGPEGITPVGIAVTALMQRGQDFLTVTVNKKKIRIFNSRKLTVSDSLILAAFDADKLIGRSGKSLSYEINGQKRLVKGTYGKPAEIYVNGSIASLETVLKMGDEITIVPAEKGANAYLTVQEVVGAQPFPIEIELNGCALTVGTRIIVNEKEVEYNTSINEGDIIKTIRVLTVNDLAQWQEIDMDYFDIMVNGYIVQRDHELRAGDKVECIIRTYGTMAMEQVAAVSEPTDMEDQTELEKSVSLQQMVVHRSSALAAGGTSVIVNGKNVTLQDGKEQYIFVDIFKYIDFDISRPQGSIVLKLNGKQAAFTDIVKNGDSIEIYWEK